MVYYWYQNNAWHAYTFLHFSLCIFWHARAYRDWSIKFRISARKRTNNAQEFSLFLFRRSHTQAIWIEFPNFLIQFTFACRPSDWVVCLQQSIQTHSTHARGTLVGFLSLSLPNGSKPYFSMTFTMVRMAHMWKPFDYWGHAFVKTTRGMHKNAHTRAHNKLSILCSLINRGGKQPATGRQSWGSQCTICACACGPFACSSERETNAKIEALTECLNDHRRRNRHVCSLWGVHCIAELLLLFQHAYNTCLCFCA